MDNLKTEALVNWVVNGQDTVDLELAHLQTEVDQNRLIEFVDQLKRYPNIVQSDPVDQRLAETLAHWLSADSFNEQALDPNDKFSNALRSLYALLSPHSLSRGYILAWMARSNQGEDFAWLIEMICQNPPTDGNALSLAFAPLLSNDDWDNELFFANLFAELSESAAINMAIDVSNHLFRNGRIPHPLTEYRVSLVELLNSIVDRLEILQSNLIEDADVAKSNAITIDESVAFVVSICDALRHIGDRQTIAPLTRAMRLEHRRIQCEAAVALATMEEEAGVQKLLELAKQPLVRKRVNLYAEELGLADQIDERFRGREAIAEAALVEWLARRENFGIPPAKCELIDRRELDWPGFENPVQCMLFEYEYRIGQQTFRSIAIGEPCTFAFKADLTQVSIDDCYQVYAGFDLEHEEIFALDLARARTMYRNDIEHLQRYFPLDVQPEWLGSGLFMGEKVLVGQFTENNALQYIAWNGVAVESLKVGDVAVPPSWQVGWYWWVGRQLFKSFEKLRKK